MKRHVVTLALALLATIGSVLPALASPTTAAANALAWLHSQQSSDGTIAGDPSRTEETVFGLVANGGSVADLTTGGHTAIDSLRAHIANEEKTAGNIGSLIMAVTAAGLDPTNFAGHNLLQDLQCTYDSATGAYNAQRFSDALAVLALPHDAAPAKATTYLIDQQQADGGWEFQAGWGSDTNTTAVVLMALVSAGRLTSTVKDRALAYLRTHQKPSGGFEYSVPFTPPGDSDPNSDALVIEALLATGENPASAAWSINDKNAETDLLTFQYPNGGFGYSRPGSSATAAPDAFSTTQALPALALRFLPVRSTTGTLPSNCSSAVTAPSATPAATSTSTVSTLARTGASPLPPIALALMMITLGLRLRSRRGR